VDTIRFYSAEILNILETLNSQGIVHIDLKPKNIMLTKDNHLKLIDLGACSFDKKISPGLLEKIRQIKNEFPNEIDDDSRIKSDKFAE